MTDQRDLYDLMFQHLEPHELNALVLYDWSLYLCHREVCSGLASHADNVSRLVGALQKRGLLGAQLFGALLAELPHARCAIESIWSTLHPEAPLPAPARRSDLVESHKWMSWRSASPGLAVTGVLVLTAMSMSAMTTTIGATTATLAGEVLLVACAGPLGAALAAVRPMPLRTRTRLAAAAVVALLLIVAGTTYGLMFAWWPASVAHRALALSAALLGGLATLVTASGVPRPLRPAPPSGVR